MSKPNTNSKKETKKWRPPFKAPDEKDIRERKTKNEYKKLLRKSEFKNFKSEVLGSTGGKKKQHDQKQRQQPQQQPEHQQQQPSGKQKHFQKDNAFTKAERDRKKAAAAASEAKAKAVAEAEATRKALDDYNNKKKSNFKHLSKKTKKGQPHMGSQMQVLLAKIEKQMKN